MYKIQKNNNGKFDVIELATEQIFAQYDEYQDAQREYKRLKSNNNKAFEGFTPSFFLIEINAY